jgi:ribulose 1,5-bisphosphate synthetase/thiazole synthase
MTVDGTNISTYGMVILSMDGYFTQPARKKLLTEQLFEENDIKFDPQEIKVSLFGDYSAAPSTLIANFEAFKTKITSALKHTFVFIGRSVTVTGVVINGVQVETFKNCVKVNFTITTYE